MEFDFPDVKGTGIESLLPNASYEVQDLIL